MIIFVSRLSVCACLVSLHPLHISLSLHAEREREWSEREGGEEEEEEVLLTAYNK
jgi:hypothetical protein